MTSHRPLSEWVTMLPLSSAGIARWDPGREVNLGDERTDARELPEFADGWQRSAVPTDLGYGALGLTHESSLSAVVELDDVAMPVRVTGEGARVIARIEDGWPGAAVSPAESAVLASEDVVVRYLLLARLAAEGQPPPGLFHTLPWDLVDRLAEEVTAVLGGALPRPEVITLGHWFTPTGSRLTPALEQLDQGLRQHDPPMIRVAATALCSRILDTDVARLPANTRQALAGLLAALRERNSFLGFAAARASRRLAGDDLRGSAAAAVRLDTRLLAAAGSTGGIRRESREAVREPFTLRLTVTATGRAEISLRAPLPPEFAEWLAESYGVLLLPVTVTGAPGPTGYLIPLRYSEGEVFGRLSVSVPPGPFVEAEVAGPPIGTAEARDLTAAEVERSVRGLRTRSAQALWDQLASTLPPAHPLRAVIARETQ